MRIIPAIDIFEGKCVRLTEGVFSTQKVYSDDPLTMAERFLQTGTKELHVVDLEGAKAGRVVNFPAIERILALKNVMVEVGGGIRTDGEVERLLNAGAVRVVIGSMAIRNPEIVATWARTFGGNKLMVALDFKDTELATEGWLKSQVIDVKEVVLRMVNLGIGTFLSTDIRRDGTMKGPNVKLYRGLVRNFPGVKWIASGGVRSIEDIRALEETGVDGVVVGKALYEGHLSLDSLNS